MYQKVEKNANFVEHEKETENFWRENDIFKKSMDARKEGPTYTFYDGPPTAGTFVEEFSFSLSAIYLHIRGHWTF